MTFTTDFSAWVGRCQTVVDTISPVQVRQMAVTLNDNAMLSQPNAAALPAGWHWLYFNPLEMQSRLGVDGHPARGDFLPPVALPRRMWAGSRLQWSRAFAVGSVVTKTSEILKVTQKSGRSGEMVFVTVAHNYVDGLGPLLREEHDIVYRGWPSADEKMALAALGARARAGGHVFERTSANPKVVSADAVTLFRYSAASFNGHRIHYDVDYCREVEGYPGLVVHGPLIATLLLGHIETKIAPGQFIRAFEFRALRPTFDLARFHLHAEGNSENFNVWSTNNIGEVGIDGCVTLG
ncbi:MULTISPECIES: MaoC family dehydratase N-terminal domain-containing protein [unclassified Polaromonas]|uniref:FAS1-like dehydratase domain-containing protein n=1 Tax=unclassified Polaromonas TaxID=2638319 RepID=UPI001A30B89A|nr:MULTISPECIES: MaoC family dehydratase N-terminal domain-containing protein [unclassified Polaromonas]MBG6073688.1 3-methylfumaryl-CoA hydratase [Polaromonas sp. CG_9.7]MBG6115690.1 3-methylfumaryl-CoA hydratase [Polaromonas sp. CG_9.2]MDH6186634.1 3-methylfumaryl-CoA hydratase [Polaromonas sp. CG_23.6]